jgi:polar amino acid transport system substrate-binding protein
MQALREGRVDAYAHDDAVLAQLEAKNPDLGMLHTPYAINFAAIGMRRGDTALKAWVDFQLAAFKSEKLYAGLIDKYVDPPLRPLYVTQFLTPRPPD